MYWVIGLIIWVLVVGTYFVFNYGANMNDSKEEDKDE